MLKKVTALAALLASVCPQQVWAYDTSGIHAFVNDDANQFADLWLNTDGGITVKVSNGRPWRPMWIVIHVSFRSASGIEIARQDLHVYCPSPNPGGGGAEKWFDFPGPGISGVDHIVLTSNKDEPRRVPEASDPIIIQVPIPPHWENLTK